MKTTELRNNIEKVLGNSIRCLLPSYWWKRIFGLIVDEVEDVRKVANNKADKSIITNIQETSQKLEEVSERVEAAEPLRLVYALAETPLSEEEQAANKQVYDALRTFSATYKSIVAYARLNNVYLLSPIYSIASRSGSTIKLYVSDFDDASPFKKIEVELLSDGTARLVKDVNADGSLSDVSQEPIQNKVVTAALNGKADKTEIPTKLSQLEMDIEIGGDIDTSAFATKEELNALQTEVINNEEVIAAAINDLNTRIGAAADTAYVDNAIASAITSTLNTEV